MSNPAWFDEEYFATQKAAQMNAIGWRDATGRTKTDWRPNDWQGELARYNADHNTSHTAFDNFLACNTSGYGAGIALGDINVSPSELFYIPVYLTSLASHYNETGFAAPGHAAGQWTAAGALSHLFDNEHVSAWEHYKTYGMEHQINPSNKFDTGAYLRTRAEIMGADMTVEDAIAAIAAAGRNPLEDYFIWGKPRGIQAVAVADPVTPGIEDSLVWGESITPPDGDGEHGPDGGSDGSGGGGSSSGNPGIRPGEQPVKPVLRNDPYDQNYVEQTIGEVNTAPDGQNTWFTGRYDGSGEGFTADTVITGGSGAMNSLVMDMEANWPGFNGVEADGGIKANVSNVGRVVLNHASGDPGAALVFNAANIAGPEQFDIQNSGVGAISLSELPATVRAVNIKDIDADGTGVAPETSLEFAQVPSSLRIGLEDVCADGGGAAAVKFAGIGEVELASYGTGNTVDLAGAKGIRKLVIANGAPLVIADSDGATIEEYDAGNASADVSIGVSNFKDGAVVRGGSGSNDTLAFMDYAVVNSARWENVENIVFNDRAEVDAATAAGIKTLWQMGAGAVSVENLKADSLTFYTVDGETLARSCAKGVVSGSIGDLTWSSCGIKAAGSELTADFVCNATNDCVIRLQGRDRLGVASVFELHELRGVITIDDPNPTPQGSYHSPQIEGIKILAEQATGLNVIHSGSMKICGALWKVADVRAELADSSDGTYHDLFKLPQLPGARDVDISAGRMDIYISGLGSGNSSQDMNISIRDASDVYIGDIACGGAGNVRAVIDSYGDTEIKSVVTRGDIDLTVSGVNIVAEENEYGVSDGFSGATVNLDFGDVHGGVGSFAMRMLVEALGGSLVYTGARGDDHILVGGLTGGTSSRIATGSGDDEVIVQTLDSIGGNNLAILNVDLGSGNDILRVFNMAQEGNLIVNATGNGWGGKTITKECSDSAHIGDYAAANLALAAVNAGFQLDAGVVVNDGVFEYGGNAYWIAGKVSGNSAYNVTLVAAAGGRADLFQADDLTGV